MIRKKWAFVWAPALVVLLVFTVCRFSAADSLASSYVGVIGDDYPSKYKNVAKDAVADEWNFYNRECVSFVAWRLNSKNGINFHNYYRGVHWGNASNWKSVASSLGYTVNTNPAKGAVYWKSTHVAWVSGVSGNTVTIEEYNYDRAGHYRYRNVSKGAAGVYYIHIKDISSSSSSASSSSGKNINSATVSGLSKKYRYSGSRIVPAVSVSSGGITLKKNRDYTVSCSNNLEIGTATMVISGRKAGGYTGSIKKKFKIVPKGTSVTSLNVRKPNIIDVKWRRQQSGTDGYQVQYSRFHSMILSSKKLVPGNSNNSCVLTMNFPENPYYVRVRTYKTKNGKKYYSKWCSRKLTNN